MRAALFRYDDGAWPNGLAIAYTLAAYTVGGYFMLTASLGVALAASLWFAHGLILSGYLFHEFAHNSIFTRAEHNRAWGTLMTWLNGSCYARFEQLRYKHVRHHVDRADVISFDIRAWLRDGPAWRRNLALALEWLYIPAVDLLMHIWVILTPFVRPERAADRTRTLAVLMVRTTTFAALTAYSPRFALLYALAYVLMVTVLRFADAFQHTYVAYVILDKDKVPDDRLRDADYEHGNTFSNLVSVRWPWLNLLLLNFSYHNAHHVKPVVPWYRLPALHRELYGDYCNQTLPMRRLLAPFHTHRVSRVLNDDYGTVSPDSAADFRGAVAVSFLTAM